MEFGMPTLIENKNLHETAELCRELGLDFIELNMNFPLYQLEGLNDIRTLSDIAWEYDIYYTIHLEENLNVCDFNEAVSQAYLDTVVNTIRMAKRIHAPLLNMHMNSGIYITLPDRKVYLYEQHKELYLQKLKLFRSICEQEMAGDDIMISIENTDGYHTFEQEGIELLLESRVFSLTWDIGHSYTAQNSDEAFILKHEDRLKHFHIHDGKDKRNHLVLGTGDIDLNEKLSIAEQNNCRCVVETKTAEALRASMQWLRSKKHI